MTEANAAILTLASTNQAFQSKLSSSTPWITLGSLVLCITIFCLASYLYSRQKAQ